MYGLVGFGDLEPSEITTVGTHYVYLYIYIMVVPLRVLTLTSWYTYIYSQAHIYHVDAFVDEPMLCKLTNVCALASSHSKNLVSTKRPHS